MAAKGDTLYRARIMLRRADGLRRAAHKLIGEHEQAAHAARKAAGAAQLCQCGHRHDSHTEAYNHNYTAGVCRLCPCMNFLLASKGGGASAGGRV